MRAVPSVEQSIKNQPQLSAELNAAVVAVTREIAAPANTGLRLISTIRAELVALEKARSQKFRWAKITFLAFAMAWGLHLVATRFVFRLPPDAAVQANVRGLRESLSALYSSSRQPLEVARMELSSADALDQNTMRYVATVTLRLRQPLYVPAVTNGTVVYRHLQDILQAAHERDLRLHLFSTKNVPEFPALPPLLQCSHPTGDTMQVRVPFIARRFGWQWRLAIPQLELRSANRTFDGDSLDYYAGSQYLIFGSPETLGEIRLLTNLANNYVRAVAKEAQRRTSSVAGAAKVSSPPNNLRATMRSLPQ